MKIRKDKQWWIVVYCIYLYYPNILIDLSVKLHIFKNLQKEHFYLLENFYLKDEGHMMHISVRHLNSINGLYSAWQCS